MSFHILFANQILGEEYGEDSTVIDVEIDMEFSDEDVLGDLAAGLTPKEIAAKYGISVQKVGSIKKRGA